MTNNSSANLLDLGIIFPAIAQSFVKLDPRSLAKNPVMFVVALVSALTTILFIKDVVIGNGERIRLHAADHHLALVHRALRQLRRSRRRRAAARRRPTRCGAAARRRRPSCSLPTARPATRSCRPPASRSATSWWSRPAKSSPPTARSSRAWPPSTRPRSPANRRRSSAKSGGDRSAVTGGTQVLSDWIRVRITAAAGSTFLDRMIGLVEGAQRKKTPNEIALNILLAGMTLIFVLAVATIPSLRRLCGRLRADRRAGRAVRHADPDHHRRAAVGDRHCRHGPPRALQRACHVGPCRRGRRRRRHAASRQDRHDHARQPPGERISRAAPASPSRNWRTPPSSPRSPTRRRKAARSSCWPRKSIGSGSATCARCMPISCRSPRRPA